MTVMAAEAGTGAVEAEGAEASAAGRTATRRTGGRTQQGTGPGRRVATRVVRTAPQTRVASKAASKAPKPPTHAQRVAAGNRSKPVPRDVARNRRVIRQGAQTGAKKLTGNYHGVVFGEWILAVLLVAAIPLSRPNRTGVSPYAGKDIVQLLAITVTYFLLAVLAASGRGQARFAAWFGGLLLLAVGLAEAAAIASAVNEWLGGGGQASQPSQPSGPKPNASAVNPGSTAPTGISRPIAQQPGTGLS